MTVNTVSMKPARHKWNQKPYTKVENRLCCREWALVQPVWTGRDSSAYKAVLAGCRHSAFLLNLNERWRHYSDARAAAPVPPARIAHRVAAIWRCPDPACE